MSNDDIIRALKEIWDELPVLAGNLWYEVEPRLSSLLQRFNTADEVSKAQIMLSIRDILNHELPFPVSLRINEAAGYDSKAVFRGGGLIVDDPFPPEDEFQNAFSPEISYRSANQMVTRYTDISCPEKVSIETQRTSVVVRLTASPSPVSAAVESFQAATSVPVLVRIQADHFELLNAPAQQITVNTSEDSHPVVFDLKPAQIGHTSIRFDFTQEGHHLGTVSLPVEVVGYTPASDQQSAVSQGLSINSNAAPPDLVLYIRKIQLEGQQSLEFTLLQEGGTSMKTFSPLRLESEPETYANRLYREFKALTLGRDLAAQEATGKSITLPAEDIEIQIQQLGNTLWKELFPLDFRQHYAANRNVWQNKRLLIISDEPFFPWELTWPYDSLANWEDPDPWCLNFNMTRWLRINEQGNGHPGPPDNLRLTKLACLIPFDSGLSSANDEFDFMQKLMKSNTLEDTTPSDITWDEVNKLFRNGNYHWIHAATHGHLNAEDADTDSMLRLERRRALKPVHLRGRQIERHIQENRPGFVFNACEVGRLGHSISQLGGWASHLVGCGAGLFIGPLWAVRDNSALQFAETFYNALAAGKTVAESVREARRAARKTGDPTWLAYTVYAHPNAKVEFAGS